MVSTAAAWELWRPKSVMKEFPEPPGTRPIGHFWPSGRSSMPLTHSWKVPSPPMAMMVSYPSAAKGSVLQRTLPWPAYSVSIFVNAMPEHVNG